MVSHNLSRVVICYTSFTIWYALPNDVLFWTSERPCMGHAGQV